MTDIRKEADEILNPHPAFADGGVPDGGAPADSEIFREDTNRICDFLGGVVNGTRPGLKISSFVPDVLPRNDRLVTRADLPLLEEYIH